jgi:hypothetical protein
MSIAELIMQGTNRASESTAWVGDSLAKLGQNVGKVLADREQQKQAQEMLPMFQQSMQEAMTYANEGDAGLAYSKLMPFLADPAVVNNPYMKNVIPAFEKGIQFAAENYARNIRAEAYRDRYSGGGGDGGLTGAELAEQAITGGVPAISQGEEPVTVIDVNGTENFTEGVTGLPQGATMAFGMNQPTSTEFSLRNQQVNQDQELIAPVKEQAATPNQQAMKAQEEFDKMPAYKQASVANVNGFNALPPQQKVQAANQSVAFDPGASKYEEAKIDLGEYGIDVGSIGVPKVNEQVRIKMTASGTTTDPSVRKTFSQDFIKVGEEQYKDNKEFISKLRDSSSKLSRERPAADLPTFKEIFQQNGGILNATLAPSQSEDELEIKKYPFVVVPRQGATPIPITEKQYEMIQTIQTVPAIANSTGLNLSASKNLQKPSSQTQYAEGTVAEQGGKRYKFTSGKWVAIQ